MAVCPNISSPAWRYLVEKLGNENDAWKYFIANGDIVPSIKEIDELFKEKLFLLPKTVSRPAELNRNPDPVL